MAIRCGPLPWTLLAVLGVVASGAEASSAQSTARVSVEENFRREPNGVILARLSPGTAVRVVGTEGNWTRVELVGWVWLESLDVSGEPDFDLMVSSDGGENLRATPSGTIVARLEEGALLGELSRQPGWAEVTRGGYVWSASLQSTPPPEDRVDAAVEAVRAVAVPAQRPGGFVTVGPAGGPVLTAPDGDTLAVARRGSDVQLVAREGNWVRVRMEGWMWMPQSAAADAPPPVAEQPTALEPTELRESPQAHTGRVVAWTLQYISLERAEAVRTDFFEGEPFLLTRFGGPEGTFVYVAVPPDRLTEVDGLVPLERISVTGRVRTGGSALTGTPIIDLLSIERTREVP